MEKTIPSATTMEKTILKALYSAARVASRSLVMQPHMLKKDLARKAAHAAAGVIGREAGRVSSSSLLGFLRGKVPSSGGGRGGRR